MYYIDTPTRRIDVFDVDGGRARSTGAAFAEIEEGAGFPDGLTVDADGCVWVALWDGARGAPLHARRRRWTAWSSCPCAAPTACAFGGAGPDRPVHHHRPRRARTRRTRWPAPCWSSRARGRVCRSRRSQLSRKRSSASLPSERRPAPTLSSSESFDETEGAERSGWARGAERSAPPRGLDLALVPDVEPDRGQQHQTLDDLLRSRCRCRPGTCRCSAHPGQTADDRAEHRADAAADRRAADERRRRSPRVRSSRRPWGGRVQAGRDRPDRPGPRARPCSGRPGR